MIAPDFDDEQIYRWSVEIERAFIYLGRYAPGHEVSNRAGVPIDIGTHIIRALRELDRAPVHGKMREITNGPMRVAVDHIKRVIR